MFAGPAGSGSSTILRSVLASFLVLAAFLSEPSAGDDGKRCVRDQDCALEAVARGEIHSFADVLAFARGQIRGQVIAVGLDREDGVWIYKMKVLTDDGRRQKLEVDAKSLKVIKLKEE
jgi:uncharacterized membrane protein YkoI